MSNRVRLSVLVATTCCAGAIARPTLTTTVGDDDGFNGVYGANVDAGLSIDPNLLSALTAIAPGVYANLSAIDVRTDSPWTPYSFRFDLVFDTTTLASVSSATITVQSASASRRSDGSGFGYAAVSASAGGPALSLGDFITTSTGVAGSAAEENIKAHVFDVTSLVGAGSVGSISMLIDGSALIGPVDLFSLDFVQLEILGDSHVVPLPNAAGLASLGLAIAARVRRRR